MTDNQGASADADRAVAASPSSPQAVSPLRASIPSAANIARAIRAALEQLSVMDGDEQGDFVASVSLEGFAAAESAALKILNAGDE